MLIILKSFRLIKTRCIRRLCCRNANGRTELGESMRDAVIWIEQEMSSEIIRLCRAGLDQITLRANHFGVGQMPLAARSFIETPTPFHISPMNLIVRIKVDHFRTFALTGKCDSRAIFRLRKTKNPQMFSNSFNCWFLHCAHNILCIRFKIIAHNCTIVEDLSFISSDIVRRIHSANWMRTSKNNAWRRLSHKMLEMRCFTAVLHDGNGIQLPLCHGFAIN